MDMSQATKIVMGTLGVTIVLSLLVVGNLALL